MRYKFTFVLMIWSLFAWGAQDEPSSFSSDDDTIHENARLRQYPGGADEESLEVQSELIEPVSYESEKAIQNSVYESFVKKKSKEDSKTE